MKNLLLTVILCFVSLTSFGQVEIDAYNRKTVYKESSGSNNTQNNKRKIEFGGLISYSSIYSIIYTNETRQGGFNINGIIKLNSKKLPRLSYSYEPGLLFTDTYRYNTNLNTPFPYENVFGVYFNNNFLCNFLALKKDKGFWIGKHSISGGLYTVINKNDGDVGFIISLERTIPIKNKSLLINLRQINISREDSSKDEEYGVTQIQIGLLF